MTDTASLDYTAIRKDMGLSFEGMAAILRLEGSSRAKRVREFERGVREPSGPVKLIYETLHRDDEPDFWWEAVS